MAETRWLPALPTLNSIYSFFSRNEPKPVSREELIANLNKKIDDIYAQYENAASNFKKRLKKIKFPKKLYYLISPFECQINMCIMGAPVVINKVMNSNRFENDKQIDICSLMEWKQRYGTITKDVFGSGDLKRIDLDLILLTQIEAFIDEMEKAEKSFQDNVKSLTVVDIDTLLNNEFEEAAKAFMNRETIIKELLQPIADIHIISESQQEKIDEIYLQLQIKFRTLIMIGDRPSIEQLKMKYGYLLEEHKIIKDNLALNRLLFPLINIKAENDEIKKEIEAFITSVRKKLHNSSSSSMESFNKEIVRFLKQIEIKNIDAYNENTILLALKPLAHATPNNQTINLEIQKALKKLRERLNMNKINLVNEMDVLKYLIVKLIPNLYKNLVSRRKFFEQELSAKELTPEDMAKLQDLHEQEMQINYFELQIEASHYPDAPHILSKLSDVLSQRIDNKTATEEEVRQYLRINKKLQELQEVKRAPQTRWLAETQSLFSGIAGLDILFKNNAAVFLSAAAVASVPNFGNSNQ